MGRGAKAVAAIAAIVSAATAATLPPPGQAAAGGPGGARAASAEPLSELPGWRSYPLDSGSPFVYPRAEQVYGDLGLITSPDGLRGPGGAAMTIRSAAGGETVVVADLGLNTGGHVDVSVLSGLGGPLRVSYSESPHYIQPEGDTRGVNSLGINDDPDRRYDLFSEPGFFRAEGIRGAQRYMSFSMDGPGEFTVDLARVAVRHLRPKPGDYTGRFLSSSKLLNRIWYAGAYTLNLNAVRDPRFPKSRFKMVDGGKRDRLIWIGDLAMQSLAGHYTVRQMPRILKRSIGIFACQQYPSGYIPMAADVHFSCPRRPGPADGPPEPARLGFPNLTEPDRLPAYTPWWVVAVADRFELTGDRRGTRRLLPVLRRTVTYFDSLRTADGLFETPPGAFNWRSFDTATGVDAHTNALWVRALKRLAYLEEQIGDPRRVRGYRRRAAALTDRLREELYDRPASLFKTNLSSPLPNHPQDANIEAVLSGVLRGDAADAALREIRKRLWTPLGPVNGEFTDDPYVSRYISPYMSGWELIARLQRKQAGPARMLLSALWGTMVDSGPRSTLWEAMAESGEPVSFRNGEVYPGRTSLAHGWSAAPVVALSGYVAGLRPLRPGWRRWLVEPQTLGLRFAQGRIETPYGPLASRWRRDAKRDSLRLTVVAPRGTRGAVAVPLLGRARTIARDGRVVWRHGQPEPGVVARLRDGYVRFSERGGTHAYAWVGAAPGRD